MTDAVVEPPGAAPAENAELALPLTSMICGESGASSVSLRVAERKPAARGVKVTATVQEALTAMAVLQDGVEKARSFAFAPLSATLAI